MLRGLTNVSLHMDSEANSFRSRFSSSYFLTASLLLIGYFGVPLAMSNSKRGAKRSAPTDGFDFMGMGAQSQASDGGFSLDDEVNRQTDASSSSGQRGRKAAKLERDENNCLHCPDPCAKGQLRCWPHKRAYDCLHKHAMKAPDSQEASLFTTIFGDNNKSEQGDLSQQTTVMEEFLTQFPDGKAKPGKARGLGFKLTSIVHSTGFRREREKYATGKLWDLELFSNMMKSMRGWDAQRVRSEWELLKANPNTERDNGGPKSAERVAIPANLLGEVGNVERDVAFEQRARETSTKAKKFSETEMEQAKSELSRGFEQVGDVAAMAREAHLALPGNALSADPSPRKELVDMMSLALGADPSPRKELPANRVPTAAGALASVGEGAKAGAKEKAADVRGSRTTVKRQLAKSLKTMREKTIVAVRDALLQTTAARDAQVKLGLQPNEYKEFQDTVGERVMIAEAWLGCKIVLSSDGETVTEKPMVALDGLDTVEPVVAAELGQGFLSSSLRVPI